MTVTVITSKAQFDEIIKKDTPVFIDFWATWCGPCRMISPFFEKLAGEIEGAEFYKVDVDDQPEIAQEVAVRAMPTFIAFKDGKKIGDIVGAHKDKLEALVKSNI
ncbi:thioredoxin [Peniophora sp. CONT]|nr:thioredoxin [Peniophora sp. CONT]